MCRIGTSKFNNLTLSLFSRETETQGRHAVALEDIAPGTVVAAGRPTVALLNPDNR